MEMLSPHFSLEEFTFSQTAVRHGIDNSSGAPALANLRKTAEGLEQVRALVGGLPIRITSGFRCMQLNAHIGGASVSQHVIGEAADIVCPAYGPPFKLMRAIFKSDIQYDQLILEYDRWVHLSFSFRNRKEALVRDAKGYQYYL